MHGNCEGMISEWRGDSAACDCVPCRRARFTAPHEHMVKVPRWMLTQFGIVLARTHTRAEAETARDRCTSNLALVVMPYPKPLHAFDGDGYEVEGAYAATPTSSTEACEGCGRGPEPFIAHVRRWACHDGGAGGRTWLCPRCLRGNHRLRHRAR